MLCQRIRGFSEGVGRRCYHKRIRVGLAFVLVYQRIYMMLTVLHAIIGAIQGE